MEVVTLAVAASFPFAADYMSFVAQELLQPGAGLCPPLPFVPCPFLQQEGHQSGQAPTGEGGKL